MNLKYPQKISFANLPTPLQYLPNLSSAFGGPNIYIKRDDLTGIGLTGNKIRKLEFLFAEAKAQKAEVVITCGGVQSNHARATAIAAAKAGMQSHLVLRASNTKTLDGNLFLDRLVDAEVTFISDEEYKAVDEIMHDLADKYAGEGQTVYVIPEGGSNALGAFGYIAAVEEIKQQLDEQNLAIDAVVLALGSGGTQAGLILGNAIHKTGWQVLGINVCDDAQFFVEKIGRIVQEWQDTFHKDVAVAAEDLDIIDGYVGKGYGLSSKQELDTIKQAARLEGILLDPVYTGKAMFGLKDQIAQGRIDKKANVLFLHTGGIFGLFPKKHLFF